MVRDLRYLMLIGQPYSVIVVMQRLIKSSSYTDRRYLDCWASLVGHLLLNLAWRVVLGTLKRRAAFL